MGGFLTRLGASEALVQHFAAECIDGEALLLLTEAHLDKYFEAESALGLRLKLLKGIERAKHAHHRDGFMSPMSQMLGAGLATAGAVAGAAAVVAFGSDGNAPDWQVKGFKQARDVVTGVAVGYESILLVGGVFVWFSVETRTLRSRRWRSGRRHSVRGPRRRRDVLYAQVSWIPPGAHLIVLLPVVFGLAFEVLVYFKT